VADNRDALRGRIEQTIQRLKLVNNAILKTESDDASARTLDFAKYVLNPLFTSPGRRYSFRKLIYEAATLKEMSMRSTWIEILENQEDKEKIDRSFKRIDEHTKNFHVSRYHVRISGNEFPLRVARHCDEHRKKNRRDMEFTLCTSTDTSNRVYFLTRCASNYTVKTGPALERQRTTRISKD